MAFCLLCGCKPKTPKTTNSSSDITGVTSKEATESNTDTNLPKADTTKIKLPKIKNPKIENPKTEPATPLVNQLCGTADFDLAVATNNAANALKGIMYNREPKAKADCSGIFHRVLEHFKGICPEAKLPKFKQARDSRSLAAWYKKNGNLKIVRNPAAEADLIQPGAVVFYGYGRRRNHYDFQKMNMDTLTLRGTGINHIAIVTSVNRVDGDLISYEMFHGRTDNKPSAITKSYKVTSYDKALPMYGNHAEPWLAVASPFGLPK